MPAFAPQAGHRTDDAFKYRVDVSRPRVGANHHGVLAREFLAAFCDDARLVELVELRDEAYGAYSVGARRGDWGKALWRAHRLLDRLGDPEAVSDYLCFFAADNQTGSKRPDSYQWFAALVAERGV